VVLINGGTLRRGLVLRSFVGEMACVFSSYEGIQCDFRQLLSSSYTKLISVFMGETVPLGGGLIGRYWRRNCYCEQSPSFDWFWFRVEGHTSLFPHELIYGVLEYVVSGFI